MAREHDNAGDIVSWRDLGEGLGQHHTRSRSATTASRAEEPSLPPLAHRKHPPRPPLPDRLNRKDAQRIRDAVTCDRPDCLALFLEPDDLAEDEEFETAVQAAGWQHLPDGHICPACAGGRGPVLERDECPRCTGRTVDLAQASTCMYCQHPVPHSVDER